MIKFCSHNNFELTKSEEFEKPIFLLAKAFLFIESMSNKKLQKLCYYAKAWYLALNDENLIPENFEAWVHGAVQPDLYQKYKIYGYTDISKLKEEDIINVPDEYLSFARIVYDSYGHFTGYQLEMLNHSEQPWLEARKGIPAWQNSSNIISEESMKKYYRGLLE